jgi:hypothetical protein
MFPGSMRCHRSSRLTRPDWVEHTVFITIPYFLQGTFLFLVFGNIWQRVAGFGVRRYMGSSFFLCFYPELDILTQFHTLGA